MNICTVCGQKKRFEGGVEGHAEYRQGLPASVGDKKASSTVDVASETDDAATGNPCIVGIKPGPSDPTADRREIVARPAAFLAWAAEMFGPVAKLRSERLMRFVEEAIELAHADNMDRTTFDAIANRVYSRPKGDVPKEIGQAQACLEMFAENIGLSSAEEAEREYQRVQSIPRDEWQRRHSAKQAIGIAALDGGR